MPRFQNSNSRIVESLARLPGRHPHVASLSIYTRKAVQYNAWSIECVELVLGEVKTLR